jgi:hypothetical protein
VETAITRDPPDTCPQWIYTLDRWDYVAWWMCQWDRAHPPGPPTFVSWLLRLPLRLLMESIGKGYHRFSADWLSRLLLLLLVLPVVVALWGTAEILHDPSFRILIACGTAALLVLWLLLLRLSGPRSEWKGLRREQHLRRMQAKALELQATGEIINRERIHWFLLLPECFQEVTELRRASPAGIEDYQFRVVTVPWVLVREVVVHEQHVFLVGPGEDGWIIPKRCFADVAAVADFLDAVHSCRRAVTHGRFGAVVPAVEKSEAIQASEPGR